MLSMVRKSHGQIHIVRYPFPQLQEMCIRDRGQIVLTDNTRITLAPGYYLISYHVSALVATPGYIQITPYYNNASHIEYGIYFKTGTNSTSAYGSNSIIIEVPAETRFSLTYNSNVTSSEGTATVTVLKLNRPLSACLLYTSGRSHGSYRSHGADWTDGGYRSHGAGRR